jgi:hypothetical protein
MGRLIFAGLLLALTACQTTGGSFCDVSKPFRLSPATVEAMTDAEVQAALEHNAKGARLCGWRQ